MCLPWSPGVCPQKLLLVAIIWKTETSRFKLFKLMNVVIYCVKSSVMFTTKKIGSASSWRVFDLARTMCTHGSEREDSIRYNSSVTFWMLKKGLYQKHPLLHITVLALEIGASHTLDLVIPHCSLLVLRRDEFIFIQQQEDKGNTDSLYYSGSQGYAEG